MLSEAELSTQRNGGTWSEVIHRDSWTNRLPVLAWLLAVEMVFLAALPLSIFLFRPLPDRGVILARIFGLLLVSYVAWMAVSLGWVEFSRTAIVWGFLALCAASGLALAVLRREILGFLRERWRFLLGAEMLFLLAFLAFALVRAANPDLWHPWRGGEKPMELAYFTAVIKSSAMPPLRPMVFRRVSELLLLGIFHAGRPGPYHRHSSHHGIQPGRALVFRTDGNRSIFPGLQRRPGSTCLRASGRASSFGKAGREVVVVGLQKPGGRRVAWGRVRRRHWQPGRRSSGSAWVLAQSVRNRWLPGV